ncbi:MAG: HAMP domain-containing sensor histidine kinase, partial [Pseudomonadota bacterium]
GNVRERLAAAALDGIIVQADTLTTMLTFPTSAGRLITIGPLPSDELEVASAPDNAPPRIGTIIDRDRVERMFAAALDGSETTASIYGIGGMRLTDSTIALTGESDVTAAPLGPLVLDTTTAAEPAEVDAYGLWEMLTGQILAAKLPPETDRDEDELPEQVRLALDGVRTAEQRATADGAVVVSLATPILSPSGTVVGALYLSSGARVINAIADDYDRKMFGLLLFALTVSLLIGAAAAAHAARPVRRLVRAAERVKAGGTYVPVKGLRPGTLLGRLNQVLLDMTEGLFNRIDAIESFAGEVAHELKNPLTSLRSAVETLPLATKPASRDRLLAVIDHDVRRIDRLISDISEASKLDAELTRRRYERFDLMRLLRAVVGAQAELAADRKQIVELTVRGPYSPATFQVVGNDSRLGQVFTNLIDNGRSFTAEGGTIRVTVERFANFIEVVVDDQGPGIHEDVLERIFERFYTDRSEQQTFGNNSGLGLAISRQIVEAHNGEIFAENRYRTTINHRDVAGARFTVRLPTAP